MILKEPDCNFENLRLDPFAKTDNILINNLSDPDIQFFNEQIFQHLEAP